MRIVGHERASRRPALPRAGDHITHRTRGSDLAATVLSATVDSTVVRFELDVDPIEYIEVIKASWARTGEPFPGITTRVAWDPPAS